MKKLSILSLSLMLAACSLNPTYEQPQAPVPVEYSAPSAAVPMGLISGADLGWQEVMREPRLRALIDLALQNNRDMLIAIQRVEEARALYGIQRSDQLPHIGANAQQSAQRMPPDMRMPGQDSINRTYSAGLGITAFELDFWGKKRSLSEAAFEQYLATDEARKSMQLGLIAQVGSSYFAWRTAQSSQDLAHRTIDAYQRSYDLVERRFQAGVASGLERNQARTTLQGAKAALAAANRQVQLASNALDLLIGQPQPATLPAAVPFGADNLMSDIPAGVSSTLLVRRPDIIAAEHRLKSTNAQIGAARAAFFPTISLTGLLGTISPQFSGLFDRQTETWAFNPTLSVPIFTAGALRNNLNLAEVRKDIAILEYEKAIQNAFREVSDALAGEESFKDQLAALRDQQSAAYQSLNLSEQRYEAGIDSFLQVQQAQINLFNIQQNFLQVGLQALQNRLELYKALGGGWTPITVTAVDLQSNQAVQSTTLN
ncbi:MAG: efflux transporter outer membrane subunit [Alcaligenaceae bacterium]|nr:efflux transporter outer membrane subunit [Alcaligenaceae bacterium]